MLDRQELGLTFSGPIGEENTQFFTSFSYQNQDDDVVDGVAYHYSLAVQPPGGSEGIVSEEIELTVK